MGVPGEYGIAALRVRLADFPLDLVEVFEVFGFLIP
jgi:hypothetical protein